MKRRHLYFMRDRFWQVAILVVLLRALSGPTGLLAYVIVAIYGLKGPRHAIEALMLCWYITLANSGIFGSVSSGSLGRYLVIFAVTGSGLLRLKSLHFSRSLFATLVLGSFIVLHSLLFSVMGSISLLKGMIWLLTMATIILSFDRMSEQGFRQTEQHLYCFLVLLLVLSALLSVLPGSNMPGYIGSGRLFRGVLDHSQALGVTGALLAVWAFGRILVREKGTTLDYFVSFAAVVVVFETGTRTGLLSIFLTLTIAIILTTKSWQKYLSNVVRLARNPFVALSFIAILLSATLNFGAVQNTLVTFLKKNTSEASLTGAYMTSRGGLLGEMMNNIQRDPLVGIGFGLDSDPAAMKVQTFAGIPIGAVVEKGVTPVAVWEEIGALGLLLTFYWIATITLIALRSDLRQFMLATAIFLLSLGEAALFSVGGMGLLSMLLLGFASKKLRQKR